MDHVWVNPRSESDIFTVDSAPFNGTLSDLASRITTDNVLKEKAHYIGAVPFPRCPGEAGLQTFKIVGSRYMQVAFSVQNGRKVQAQYIRKTSESVDPAVTDSMAANVCVLP